MKELINEYDHTKKMLDIIRGGYVKKLINEEETDFGGGEEPLDEPVDEPMDDGGIESDVDESNLSPVQGDSIFNEELKKLQDTVDPKVKITNFKIYPEDDNVLIEGVFLQNEGLDSGIKFRMKLEASDIEIKINSIGLNDKVLGILQKLKGYYENWVDDWALRINEYK